MKALVHANTLEYGWWEHNRQPLPDTLRDPKNFVLHAKEVAQYVEMLAEMKKSVDAAYADAKRTDNALRLGRVPSFEYDPQPLTIAHVLEFMCTLAKNKLAAMQFLVDVTKAMKAKQENAQ